MFPVKPVCVGEISLGSRVERVDALLAAKSVSVETYHVAVS